jgi:hypothetical protein
VAIINFTSYTVFLTTFKAKAWGRSFIQLLPICSKILHDYKTIHWIFYAFRILYFEARYCGRIICAYFLLTPEINKSVCNQTTSSIWYNTFYDTTGLFVPIWINKSEGNRSDVKVIIPILPHRFDSGDVFILAADLYENDPQMAESDSLFNRRCFNDIWNIEVEYLMFQWEGTWSSNLWPTKSTIQSQTKT